MKKKCLIELKTWIFCCPLIFGLVSFFFCYCLKKGSSKKEVYWHKGHHLWTTLTELLVINSFVKLITKDFKIFWDFQTVSRYKDVNRWQINTTRANSYRLIKAFTNWCNATCRKIAISIRNWPIHHFKLTGLKSKNSNLAYFMD